MRKRIKELAEGRVEVSKPIVEFSSDKLELEVFEGEDYKGYFTITSSNQIPIKGRVYSANPRMECLTEEFEGMRAQIAFQFHSTGLVEGDILKGDFFVEYNQGEYNLSFAVIVSKPYETHTTGTIKNLDQFVELAREHWQEAKDMFYSPGFLHLFKQDEVTERLLYEGIRTGNQTSWNLEEFLLACRKKEAVLISVDYDSMPAGAKSEGALLTFEHVKETLLQKFIVTKNTWGQAEFDVLSDAKFIKPQKKKLTADDFLGSEATVGFYLCPEHMHAGKNYGRLTLKNIRQEITLPICARKDMDDCSNQEPGHTSMPSGRKKEIPSGHTSMPSGRKEEIPSGHTSMPSGRKKEIKQLQKLLVDTYIDYRLKRIVTGRWAIRTCRTLDDLIARDNSNVWYRLLKAQAYLTNGQRQDAEWILEEFKRKYKEKSSPQWGYYLYICTLMDQEELYISRLTEEIEQIFLEHNDNLLLFWCLLFLRHSYEKNPYRKLRAIEKRVMDGEDSPVLYAEAYCLYCQEPYLLHRLTEFELKILNWARKRQALNKAIAEQMISVFPERMPYKRSVLFLLEACDGILDVEQLLPVACGYLIRNQKYGRRYFRWYEKGVAAKQRITGLYEAYLLSMDTRAIQELPKVIQMYFKYNSQLSYKQKAILYVNIIAAKKSQPRAYEQHYLAMEKFAWEQLGQGHIDDNLAVVYEEALSGGIYPPEIWEALADVLFVHRLTCLEPEAARVIVLQRQLKKPMVIPITDGEAYFPLYSNEYSILIEDTHGKRYSSSMFYQLEKLMYPARYLRPAMSHSKGKLPYLLYYFANRSAQEIFEEKDLVHFETVMDSEEVSSAYKSWLFPKMCRLLFAMDLTDEIQTRLQQTEVSRMPPKDRGCIMEICIKKRLYEEAYQIAETYGCEHVPAAARVLLLNNQIQKTGFKKEELLLKLTVDTFLAGKYNDTMLSYLCSCYQGPVSVMASILECAELFDLCVFPLAERILVQMLYTSEFVTNMDEIYQCYEERGNSRIKGACLTLFSYNSFVRNAVPLEHFFQYLRRFYLDQEEMNEVCELALLQYYSGNPSILKQDEKQAEALLVKYLQRGTHFAFFKQLGSRFVRKYQLYDKYYIEYRGQGQVWIHYTFADGSVEEADYISEEMTEVYDGVFVKKLTLFLGEEVQYYISEVTDGKTEVTESGMIQCISEKTEAQTGRYGRLNEMIGLLEEGKQDELEERMQAYRRLNHIVQDTFTIIA